METVVSEETILNLDQIEKAKAIILFVSSSITDDIASSEAQMGMIYTLDYAVALLSDVESSLRVSNHSPEDTD